MRHWEPPPASPWSSSPFFQAGSLCTLQALSPLVHLASQSPRTRGNSSGEEALSLHPVLFGCDNIHFHYSHALGWLWVRVKACLPALTISAKTHRCCRTVHNIHLKEHPPPSLSREPLTADLQQAGSPDPGVTTPPKCPFCSFLGEVGWGGGSKVSCLHGHDCS